MRKLQVLITLFLALFLGACGTHILNENYSSKSLVIYEEDEWKVFFDNGYFGFKDQNDSVVIEPKFDLALDFKNGIARIVQDGKYGLIDKNGKFIIEPQFDDVGGKIKCRKRKIKCRIFATNYLSFNLKLKL